MLALSFLALLLAGCETNGLAMPATEVVDQPGRTADESAALRPEPWQPRETIRIGLRRVDPNVAVVRTTGAGALRFDGGKKIGAKLPANATVKVYADWKNGGLRVIGPGVDRRVQRVRITGRGLRSFKGRRYQGAIVLSLGPDGLVAVNEIALAKYLEGVLPGEIPASFRFAAQKALAVAARSYALSMLDKHSDEGFDLCDTVDCQVYLGYHRGSKPGLRAVQATAGLALWHAGRPAYCFYSADCGGVTARIEDVPLPDSPPVAAPYLRSVADHPETGPDYCARSSFHSWERRLTLEEIADRLNDEDEDPIVGELSGLEFTEFDATARVRTVKLLGLSPVRKDGSSGPLELQMTGWEFRIDVGARTLRSTMMTVRPDADGSYVFSGKGNGHGVGLCQIGANGMARAGKTTREILAHYYPGAYIARIPQPKPEGAAR